MPLPNYVNYHIDWGQGDALEHLRDLEAYGNSGCVIGPNYQPSEHAPTNVEMMEFIRAREDDREVLEAVAHFKGTFQDLLQEIAKWQQQR